MTEQMYRRDCGSRVAIRTQGAAGVNDGCHSYTGGVTRHDGRVLANPFVYPIFWGSAYSTRGPTGAMASEHAALTSITDFIQTLRGAWLNGLAQYGVSGWASSRMADTPLPQRSDRLTDAQICAGVNPLTAGSRRY